MKQAGEIDNDSSFLFKMSSVVLIFAIIAICMFTQLIKDAIDKQAECKVAYAHTTKTVEEINQICR
jgi:hypothetical protein